MGHKNVSYYIFGHIIEAHMNNTVIKAKLLLHLVDIQLRNNTVIIECAYCKNKISDYKVCCKNEIRPTQHF